jgi:2-oxoglutarate ferredoxin oxidoreductase subunit beta
MESAHEKKILRRYGTGEEIMNAESKPPESLILVRQAFKRPESLKDVPFHFCSGCHHGIAHRLVAEAIDFFGIQGKTIGVASVGCSVFLYDYFDIDVVEAPHGRASAVATGLKRARKNRIVFTYQGDGDLASIGIAEVVHTANRGENITIIFANNGVYGMTGGQMAPTTLLGQKTTTSPYGREFGQDGYPIRMAEMIATLEGSAFVARVAVNTPSNLMKAKKAVRKAFQMQIEGIGFSFVEFILACPTNWGLSPLEANKRVEDQMIPYFPLGVFKERTMADYL